MAILKRDVAPITDAAWAVIDEEARRSLRADLSARRFVDVTGPKGAEYAGVNMGRIQLPKKNEVEGVRFGIRQVQPLIETRVPFELNIWELDNVERGAEDPDLDALTEACRKAACFEDRAIYEGFEDGCIHGLADSSPHDKFELDGGGSEHADAVAAAVMTMLDAGVDGPFGLVLGSQAYRKMITGGGEYPPLRRLRSIIEGPIIHSRVLTGGLVVSMRGGDLELVLGEDFAVGYETHDAQKVRLFVTESFTFRVLDPAAVVALPAKVAKAKKK
jgi:uncharacterized linocin/CFP29 family protein